MALLKLIYKTEDHGTLLGLADDDHTQYLKEKLSSGTAAEIPVHTHASSGEGGQTAHSILSGLSADDHSAYMLDAGTPADNTLIRADGTDGRIMQTSGVVVDDSDNITTTGWLKAAYVNITDEANGYQIDDYTVLTILKRNPTNESLDSLLLGRGPGPSVTGSGQQNFLAMKDAGGLLTTETGNTFINYLAGGYVKGGTNIGIGRFALKGNDAGGVVVTGGIAIGDGAGQSIATGADYPILIGYLAGSGLLDGTDVIAIGRYAGKELTTGDRDIFIGPYSAQEFTTEDDYFVVDNQSRASAALTKAEAIIVGVMDAVPANQTLAINAALTVNGAISAISLNAVCNDNEVVCHNNEMVFA